MRAAALWANIEAELTNKVSEHRSKRSTLSFLQLSLCVLTCIHLAIKAESSNLVCLDFYVDSSLVDFCRGVTLVRCLIICRRSDTATAPIWCAYF